MRKRAVLKRENRREILKHKKGRTCRHGGMEGCDVLSSSFRSPELGSCSHCKKKFHRAELPEHIAGCPERYVQCRECNKILSNLQTLERHHKRFHLKLREVPCTLCDKMFIDEAASRKHLKTVHFKVKNFHCPHCDKSFSQRNKLTYHVRTHSGEKPFCCPECGRAFSLLWNLKTHLRTHTGEKPYCCDVCGRKFTQKQNMTSHMTTHKKPKLARSGNLYVTYTSSADNLDYFSVSELRQAGKATMVTSEESSNNFHQSSVTQAGHYLIDQIGNIAPTVSSSAASGIASISQGSDPENGLGLLSSVARKGDGNHEYSSDNVEVDGIVDQAHLAHTNNPAIDQVVEVLVQPQGGHGDTTISLTTSEVAPGEHETYVSTSNAIEGTDVFQNRDATGLITPSSSDLQQQAVGAHNVIPIGNANLSGLANILQNPEVLAAINAAAASNKFIVIGPVGMLSGSTAGATNTVSIATAYSGSGGVNPTSSDSEVSVSFSSSEAVASIANAPTSIGNDNLMQISAVNHMEPGLTASCDVEMIAADTSQDAAVGIANISSDDTGNIVQSSVSSGSNGMFQSESNPMRNDQPCNSLHDNTDDVVVQCVSGDVADSQVVSSQGGTSIHRNAEGEVSSSACAKGKARENVMAEITNDDAESNFVQSSNGISSGPRVVSGDQEEGFVFPNSASFSSNEGLVTQSNSKAAGSFINSAGGAIYYAVQQGGNEVLVSAAQPSGNSLVHSVNEAAQQFIVTMDDQLVSSSPSTTALASTSLIASSEISGTGQSMVMVTADGQNYFTAMNLPDDLTQGGPHQIILTPAGQNNLAVQPSAQINSIVDMVQSQSTSNAIPTSCFQECTAGSHFQEHSGGSNAERCQATDIKELQGMDIGDFTVTDSTSRVRANSSTAGGHLVDYTDVSESESRLEVSGSHALSADSMQPNSAHTVSAESIVDSQIDSNIVSPDAFPADASVEEETPCNYSRASMGNSYAAQQSAFVDETSVTAASSNVNADSLVSGTENFVSSNLQSKDPSELQRTGVTSSNFYDNNAESTTVSGNLSQIEKIEGDHGDSQVTTSLQI